MATYTPPLQQHPDYARTVAAMGGRPCWLRLSEDLSTLVLMRRFGPLRVSWLARGPCWSGLCTDRQRAMLDRLNAALPGVVLALPETPADAAPFQRAGFRPIATSRHVAMLDLHPDLAALRAAQHGKWRNRLRLAERQNLRVQHRPFDPGKDTALLRLDALQRRARGYRALPLTFTTLWSQADPHATRLFYVTGSEGVAAFMLFLLHGAAATYHIGWSGAEGRTACAHHLILWQAITWLAAQGIARLDLGGVETDQAPGLARFKIGTGAQIRPLGPLMLRLPRPIWHKYSAP